MRFIALAFAVLSIVCGNALARSEPADTDIYGPALSTQVLPGEGRYVYLATAQHLLDGVTPELVAALKAISENALMRKQSPENVEDLGTSLTDPLLLQADPASIVAQATSVIESGLNRREDIAQTLAEMEAQTPALTDPPLVLSILDNGVRFRFALAQALYALELRDLPRSQQDAVTHYAEQTLTLRNQMELLDFEITIDGWTDEAIAAQRNAYASFQRGVLSEVDPYSFIDDGRRAADMSAQAREGIASEMRGMLFQILLIGAIVLP